MFGVFVSLRTFTSWFILGPVSNFITNSDKWSSKPVAFVALVRDIFAFPKFISYPVPVHERSRFITQTITWRKNKKGCPLGFIHIIQRIYEKLVARKQDSTWGTGMKCFSVLTATASFLSIFCQRLQYWRQHPNFSAHGAALIAKTDLSFPAFSLRFVDFNSAFAISFYSTRSHLSQVWQRRDFPGPITIHCNA